MSTATANVASVEKGPQGQNLKPCDRCEKVGFKNELIYFEKLGEDPATGKVKWKLHNKDGTEHEHKGNQQRGQSKKYRIAEIVGQVDSIKDANALLAANKWHEVIAVVPSLATNAPVIYIIGRKEAEGA
jgi:hypothetical protein